MRERDQLLLDLAAMTAERDLLQLQVDALIIERDQLILDLEDMTAGVKKAIQMIIRGFMKSFTTIKRIS